ncbi:hypothetical protein HF563_08650 [Acidithiobacillus ferridurans]|nr:hypothetical protein [Acidithiobacillus ferridurans]
MPVLLLKPNPTVPDHSGFLANLSSEITAGAILGSSAMADKETPKKAARMLHTKKFLDKNAMGSSINGGSCLVESWNQMPQRAVPLPIPYG